MILGSGCDKKEQVKENNDTPAVTTKSFISTWQTTVNDEMIILPLLAGYSYNFAINWGDGTSVAQVTSHIDNDIVHFYAVPGTYTVTMTGLAQAWSFDNKGSKLNIRTVVEFGDMGWTYLADAFSGSSNLTSFSGGNTAAVTDMSRMFYHAEELTSLDLSTFNTSSVTDMNRMFDNACKLTSLNLSNFNTSSVTNMMRMFNFTYKLTSINLSNFDTSSVTDMSVMFQDALELTSLDLSNFDTSSVTTMLKMFQGARKLTSLDLSNFDTSSVTNMYRMFYETVDLTSLNASHWNIMHVMNHDLFLENDNVIITCNDQDNTPNGTGTAATGTLFGWTCH